MPAMNVSMLVKMHGPVDGSLMTATLSVAASVALRVEACLCCSRVRPLLKYAVIYEGHCTCTQGMASGTNF